MSATAIRLSPTDALRGAATLDAVGGAIVAPIAAVAGAHPTRSEGRGQQGSS